MDQQDFETLYKTVMDGIKIQNEWLDTEGVPPHVMQQLVTLANTMLVRVTLDEQINEYIVNFHGDNELSGDRQQNMLMWALAILLSAYQMGTVSETTVRVSDAWGDAINDLDL